MYSKCESFCGTVHTSEGLSLQMNPLTEEGEGADIVKHLLTAMNKGK